MMKSTLLGLSVLLLTYSVGISIPQLFQRDHSSESSSAVPSTGAGSVVSAGCPVIDELAIKDEYLVISVLSDTEFFLGQRKVALTEIPGGVRRVLGIQPVGDRVVIIKSAAGVRFENLNLIADEVRSANVKCIQFVLDKEKRTEPLRQPPSLTSCTRWLSPQ